MKTGLYDNGTPQQAERLILTATTLAKAQTIDWSDAI